MKKPYFLSIFIFIFLLLAIEKLQAATYFFTSTTGASLNTLTNWTTNSDGTGANPTTFTTLNDIFYIRPNAVGVVTANWVFGASGSNSLMTIVDSGTVTVNDGITITLQGKSASSPSFTVVGTINFLGTGKINIITGNVACKFTLGAGANMFTNNSTGLVGTGCSILNSGGAALSVEFNAASNITMNANTQSILLPASLAVGNLTLSGSGTKTLSSELVVNGNLTIGSGVTFNPSTFLVTLNGNFINGGTYTSGSGGVTIGGTATQSIAGFSTSGTVSMTKTAGVATMTGAINGAGLTMNGIGGTLNLGTGLTHAFTGVLTRTNGTLEANDCTINYSGASVSGTGGTFNLGTSTFNYTGTTQNVAGLTYYNLNINNTGTKTMVGAVTVNNDLNISSGTTLAGATFMLTINGAVTNAGTLSSTTGGITIGGTTTQSIPGLTTTGPFIFNKSAGTATLQGAVSAAAFTMNGAGTLNLGTGLTHTFSGAVTNTAGTIVANDAILNLSSNTAPTGTGVTFQEGTSTVKYTGGAQSIINSWTYYHLTLGGTGAKTFPTGTTTVNGILSVENGTSTNTFTGSIAYGPNATLQYNAGTSARTVGTEWPSTFTSLGGVIIKGTGAITLNGAKVLGNSTNVPLNITTGATLTPGAYLITLHGDFIKAGNLTSGAGGFSFEGTLDQLIPSLTTTGPFNFNKSAGTATLQGAVSAAAFTMNGVGTLNLGTGLTHTFSGAVTNTAGTIVANDAILNLSSITAPTGTGVTFQAGTSTVKYTGVAQTIINSWTYYHLTLGGTGAKTFPTGTTTVNGILSVENGTSVNTFTGSIAYGANATLQYNAGTSARIVGAEWPSTFTSLGGVIIKGTGAITLNGAKVLGNSTNVPLNITTGATLTPGAYLITLHGDFINAGNLTPGAGGFSFEGTLDQSVPSFTTTGPVSMQKTGGTLSFTGAANGSNLVINGLGGTLNLGTGLTHTFTGAWTNTVGTVNCNSSTLKVAGAVTLTSGVINIGTSTIEYNGTGAQTVLPLNYYNLTISGARGANNITLAPGVIGVAGIFTRTSTSTSGTYVVTGNTVDFNGTVDQTIPGFTTTVFPAYNHVILSGSGTKTMAATGLVVNGNLTIGSGVTFNPSTFLVTLNGNFINGGTYTSGSGGVTIGGTATQSIAGFSTSGTVSMTKTAGVATMTGAINGAGLTMNGLGGTLHLGTGLTHAFTGVLTRTNGTLEANDCTINYSGATVSGTGGTFNLGTSTFNYTGTTQNVAGLTYYNLNINNTGTKTMVGIVTVNNDLNISSGTTFNPSTFLVTLNGNFINGGTYTSGSGGVTIGGTATQSIAGFTTTGLLSMTKTAGVATLTGAISGVAFTVNGSGGTLNLGTGLTHTFTGAWTNTAGTVNCNSSTLIISGVVTLTSGVINTGTGTIEYTGTGVQTVLPINYYHLTISGNRGNNDVTLAAGVIGVAGQLTISSTSNQGRGIVTGNTIDFNGTGAQTIPANTAFFPAYNILIISNAGIKTIANATSVTAFSLEIKDSANLDIAGTGQLTITKL